MKKLYIKRISLDFILNDSKTIDIAEIEQNLKENYPNHSITQLNELTTITDKYLILTFSIVEMKQARSVRTW